MESINALMEYINALMESINALMDFISAKWTSMCFNALMDSNNDTIKDRD